MPKGLPSARSAEGPLPLGLPRLENVPLVKVGVFRAQQRAQGQEDQGEDTKSIRFS